MPSTLPDNDKLNPSGINLPAYILLRPEGVFVNLSPPPPQDILLAFLDRFFSSEARFAGLDYAGFLRLLYGIDSATSSASDGVNSTSEVRIASGIAPFPPERMALYKSAKIMDNGDRAEYMFQQAYIETVTDEPVYGEPDADGVKHVVDHIRHIDSQPTQLDFDEFVASMWTKGVRFGIKADAVRDAIKKGSSARIDIACQLDPTDSKDAVVIEESEHLRQDNAPLILANGKADLRRAKNRFPQVAKNERMLRKVPRSLGKPGYRVSGTIIEARIPEDLDLSTLAGEGTRIDQVPGGELLVANIDGFLVIDENTGTICITTKIENKGGISAKSTGDLILTVDNYTEHGEVQEGRVVEGKHMTFLSNVYGTVISKGNLELGKNLSGGRAQSIGGNIFIKGNALGSTLEAWDGKISAEIVEGSLIMAKSVAIGKAVNCEIIAEELQLGIAEGCAIAGKNLQITSSNIRKNRETIISMQLPDLAYYEKQIAEARAGITQIKQAIQTKNQKIAASHPAFAKYLAMDGKIRAGTITLTPEQQAGWQQIVTQFAPIVKDSEDMMKKCLVLEETIKQLAQKRETCGAGEYCKIEAIQGDTIVQKISSNQGMSIFRNMPMQELRAKLQQPIAQARIFSGDSGSFEWHFEVPALPAG